MVNEILKKSKKLLTAPQSSIFSAASVIMVMIVASKLLGFVRQRTLFTFFDPASTDLFLAAFEIPDLIFEVFIYGVLSAAFIPVFSRYLSKAKQSEAWHVATATLNIMLLIFAILSILVLIFAEPMYALIVGDFSKKALGISGGFSATDVARVASLSKVLLLAQLFFVVSSFTSAVLESYKRFLIPAIAPLFYNIGIILGTIILSPRFGLYGPVIGAVVGAMAHFAIQAPLAFSLGFRPKFIWDPGNKGVKRLLKLAAPRVVELSFFQIRRFVWLFLASLVSGGFTYLKSADLLQTLPIGVFGVSMAKAALPTLSIQATKKRLGEFRKTFYTTLNQILFFVVPVSVFLGVLRVPIVRLVFGATRFDWSATVQTGYVLSAFALGSFAYAGSLLTARGFYALHDTKTPVAISIVSIIVNTVLGFYFVLSLGFGTWGIALAYSISGILQFTYLTMLLIRRIKGKTSKIVLPFGKTLLASLVSGSVMFLVLKIFDRSVWVKRLSFLSNVESTTELAFERFVLDTRYTGNLIVLTIAVSIIGVITYLLVSVILRSKEAWYFFGLIRRVLIGRTIGPISSKEKEQVSPPPTDSVL